jgi:hypothetical protein
LDVDGKPRRIWCGHLFNAAAERLALGQSVGEGEECCIALEPIADARLSFAPDLWVQQLYPEFTGVELCCGHRFSAVCLLWHWCISPMVCPVCRAKFCLETPRMPRHGQTVLSPQPTTCRPENFPAHAWNQLNLRIQTIKDEEEAENQRISVEYIRDGMMHDAMENIISQTMQSVLGDPRTFHVIISVQDDNSPAIVRCIQLHRYTDINNEITETMRFRAQYAHLRRFSSIVTTAPPDELDPTRPHSLHASLVICDPINTERMIEIAKVDAIDVTPGRNLGISTSLCDGVSGVMQIEFCDHSVTGVVPRLMSLSFSLNTASLLDAVGHLYAYNVTVEDDVISIAGIDTDT